MPIKKLRNLCTKLLFVDFFGTALLPHCCKHPPVLVLTLYEVTKTKRCTTQLVFISLNLRNVIVGVRADKVVVILIVSDSTISHTLSY